MPFDGHFWVVRDGRIIDPFFKEYNEVIRINKLDRTQQRYLPADENTQRLWKTRCELRKWNFEFNKETWVPLHGFCYQNAVSEIFKNGGELVFGSMGWKYAKTPDVHYEFGGQGWTLMDFDFRNASQKIDYSVIMRNIYASRR
jgi:hypothetical protein